MTSASTAPRPGRRLLLAAGLITGGLVPGLFALCAPASAQFFIDEPDVRVSPRGVVAGLARRGYREITPPFFDGDTYTLEAADPRGVRVRLVIDAFDGAILDRLRAEVPPIPPRLVGRPALPGYGWTDEEPGPPPEARPPRRVERSAPRVASVAPTLPPPVSAPPTVASPPLSLEPPAPAASPARNPLGLNPDAAGGGPRPARAPVEPRRSARVAPPAPARPAPTAVAPAPPVEAPQATAPKTLAAEAARPARPVRVIGGVTPAAPPVPTAATPAPAVPATPTTSPTE